MQHQGEVQHEGELQLEEEQQHQDGGAGEAPAAAKNVDNAVQLQEEQQHEQELQQDEGAGAAFRGFTESSELLTSILQ